MSHDLYYRNATVQLETALGITTSILRAWVKPVEEFKDAASVRHAFPWIAGHCKGLGKQPWCDPPEILKVFWVAFVLMIVSIGASAILACCNRYSEAWDVVRTIIVSVWAVFAAWLTIRQPLRYGRKFVAICDTQVAPPEAPGQMP